MAVAVAVAAGGQELDADTVFVAGFECAMVFNAKWWLFANTTRCLPVAAHDLDPEKKTKQKWNHCPTFGAVPTAK